jgi:methylated-DNA-[protein]-cysteine S-methyltransferase
MSVETRYHLYYHSPVGWLDIETIESAVTSIRFCDGLEIQDNPNEMAMEALRQIDEYFAGERDRFDLPLEMKGTPFQKTVWEKLLDIPYGKTISYLELSRRLGNVNAVRAAGHANGQNPLPIVVPCHRVIGADGNLIGYGGGLWRKKWLLSHEEALPQPELF